MTFTVIPVPAMGAEDVVVAADGTVYTGTEDGTIWVVDPVSGSVRRVAETGGPALQPKPKDTIRVQAYDDDGTLAHDLDIDHAGFHMVTGVREHEGRVWMGSLHEPSVAVHDLA